MLEESYIKYRYGIRKIYMWRPLGCHIMEG